MRRAANWVAGAAILVLVGVGAYFAVDGGSADAGYVLKVSMPNAANLVDGSPVEIGGMAVGKISALTVQENRALVEIDLPDGRTPLHQGTRVQVQWKSLVGERVVEVLPGPATSPVIPSGSVIEAGAEQVEVDQLLATLDPQTRAHLSSTVQQLDGALRPQPADLNNTLKQAGPAVGALGDLLKAVGQDGPAVRSLVTDLQNMIAALAARQDQLRQVVGDTTDLTGAAAAKQDRLRQALAQLPSTLDSAKRTLDEVPGAVDQTIPVLDDLRPASRQLTSVAQNLSPLLTDLRPTIAALRPTLVSATQLLGQTPALLDSAHDVVPSLTNLVAQLNPAVNFLRPYTPDLVGWLSNWGNAFAGYDSHGHIFHGLVQAGTAGFDDNPGIPIGTNTNISPPPGFASGQPWTDANGSGMR